MTAIELQEQKDEAQGDLREQIHGVRLEVEKVRTEMVSQVGGLEMRVCDRIGGGHPADQAGDRRVDSHPLAPQERQRTDVA